MSAIDVARSGLSADQLEIVGDVLLFLHGLEEMGLLRGDFVIEDSKCVRKWYPVERKEVE